MLKRIVTIVTVLFSGLLAVILPACDNVNLEKLTPGVTTMLQVRQIMGDPTMEWEDADGSTTWEYTRMPYGIVNYMIDFGPDRIVRAVRQVLTEENFAKVRPGMSRDQIRRLLGQPVKEQHFERKREYVWNWKTRSDGSYDYFFDVYFDENGHVTKAGPSANALR